MKTLCSFLTKFASIISWSLSCFDRVIFKGHLPISRPFQMENFIDYTLKIRRCDFFKKTGPQWSHRLVDHAKGLAAKYDRPFERRAGKVDKDAWAKQQLRDKPVKEGLIGIVCVTESCGTFKLAYGDGRPHLVYAAVPQRVLYYYFLDRDLGFMHVRLQTWAPFTCQIYVNGHDYVAQQMKRREQMYDKLALLLRVETVINQPGDFKVFRECQHRDGKVSMGWYPMCKGVGNLPHYQKHALASNYRYLEALAAVDDPTPGYDDLALLTEAQRQKGRSYAGFNPVRQMEARLLAAVLAGEHIAKGFLNRDIRVVLYPSSKISKQQQRRNSAAVGRLLKRLHVRGMLAKIPHTRRWRVTEKGRRIIGDVLRTYRRYTTQAA